MKENTLKSHNNIPNSLVLNGASDVVFEPPVCGDEKTDKLFKEDYLVYADRGSNCIDWSDTDM